MSRSRVLGPLSGENLRIQFSGSRVRRFRTGEVVFHEGDLADSMQLIIRGRFATQASTPSGETATIAIHGEGEFLGIIELLRDDPRRTVTVVSLEPGETLSINREQLRAIRRRNPETSDLLLSMMADDVARYAHHLLDALYVSAEIRVLRRLLEASVVYGGEEVYLTQSQLAQLAGTSRTTVNKVLRRESDNGTLRISRGRTIIVDRAEIERRAWASVLSL